MPALEALLARLSSWRNRGLTHIFLGHPESDAADKTTTEPGGAFSPGVWTCGVQVWINAGAGWTCAEDQPSADVAWVFIEQPGGAPVAMSRWRHDGVTVEHRLAHRGEAGMTGSDVVQVTLRCATARAIAVAVAITPIGPAGSPAAALTWDPACTVFTRAGGLRVVLEPAASGTAMGLADPARGLGAAGWQVALVPGVDGVVSFRTHHRFAERRFARDWQPPAVAEASVAQAMPLITAQWNDLLPARIHAPDPRIALAWERSAFHLLAAMECGRPRIGAVNYPILWLRDGILIVRALDLIGRGDLARVGCDEIAPLIFSGGFGAEADAPGEGIWVLAKHAEMSGDLPWLAQRFPVIAERVGWIRRMRTATGPIRALSENRIPSMIHDPGASLVCTAAEHGLVRGRMDWHRPDFYINCWCQAGLREAAAAASCLGRINEARQWSAEAAELDELIAQHLLEQFGNDRDPACVPHPSGALNGHADAVRTQVVRWLNAHRIDRNGARVAEPLWTYFEAAQAHNAFLCGERDLAWTLLNGMFAPDGPRDAAAFIEGKASGNEYLPFRNDTARLGWLDPTTAQGGNMPHNWTTAEVLMTLRDVFVRDDSGQVVIGSGVPAAWLVPGARFGCDRLPTRFGGVSWSATVQADRSLQLTYSGPAHRTDFPTV